MIVNDSDLIFGEKRIKVRDLLFGTSTFNPTLVFLHDALGSIESWSDFPELLCKSLKSNGFIYDRLGHGKSSERKDPRSLDYLEYEAGEILPALLESHQIENPFLIGSSDGASIALLFAASTQCAGLVSLAGHIKVEEITIEAIKNTVSKLKSPFLNERLVTLHGHKTEKLISDWDGIWLSPEFRNWNITQRINSIECPVLVLQGKDDEYASQQHCEDIASAIGQNAECRLLEDCGHFPHRDQTERVIGLISDFFNSQTSFAG